MHKYRLTNFTKNSFGPTLNLNNEFNKIFLEDKQSALSPIYLDDSIQVKPFNSNKLSLTKTNSKGNNDKNKLSISSDYPRKSIKSSAGSYGSNIILITNKEEDSKECLIIDEINKLLKDPRNFRSKKTIKRKRYIKYK